MNKKVYLKNFGCQMNDRDSEAVKGLLLAEGYAMAETPEEADIVLFNTCSVRRHAEERVWSEVGRILKSGKQEDGRGKKEERRRKRKPMIGVIGCMAENYKEKVFRRAAGVDIVCGPSHIDNIALYLEEAIREKHRVIGVGDKKRRETLYHTDFREAKDHAYVVISEGCENFCSYCIVPYTRGALKHRAPEEILSEAREAVASGITSITLLGQNVNSYRCEITFVELLRRVSEIEGLKELSFVTSHPKDISPELFDLMAECPVIKKYLHLPVQSGSDRVLERMGRQYTAGRYLEIVDAYRRRVYNGQLSTDFIVGFPTERDEDFEKTLALARRVKFDSAFIFKYSPRPNTAAARLPDDVPEDVKKRRHAALLELQKEISRGKRDEKTSIRKDMKNSIYAGMFVLMLSLLAVAGAEADIDGTRTLFLKKQYWQVIQDCGDIIKANPNIPASAAEAHYLMGASYVNLFDFTTAKKNFQEVVDKYNNTAVAEDAYLALGDIELLQENFHEALKAYTAFYLTAPSKKRMATVYFRLAEVNLRLGNKDEYKKYLGKLEKEFPLSFEAADARRLEAHEAFYTVQVGAFTNYDNAETFIEELKKKGYDVYSVLCMLSGKKLCRIRVGKFKTSEEAEVLRKKLEADGYFSKIFPLREFRE